MSKKRTCTAAAVKDRFLKLLASTPPEENPLRRIAVLRYTEGSIKIVDEAAFNNLLVNWPPREAGLEAFQAYLPSAGSAGTIYRNNYKVVSDKGRVTTTTWSFTTIPPDLAHSGCVRSDIHKAVKTQSKAARLNATLDGATRSIVRYLESAHNVRVINIDMDYVVDSSSQLWLSWIGEATVATGDAISDLTLAGLEADRGAGRDAWLPTDIRQQAEADKRIETSKLLASGRSRSPSKTSKRNRGQSSGISEQIGNQQVASAAEVTEALGGVERYELSRRGMREKVDDEERRAMGGATLDDLGDKVRGSKYQGESRFPNPLKGQGDYGSISLRDPLMLELDEDGAQRVRTDEVGDTLPARMSYQSIARAREEGKRLSESEGKGGVEKRDKGRGGVFSETAASEARRKWAEQRGDKPGGTANFYNEVTVTPKDMQVYALLDRARRIRERQEQLAKESSSVDSTASVGFADTLPQSSSRGSRRRERPRSMEEGYSQTMSVNEEDALRALASESSLATDSVLKSQSGGGGASNNRQPTWRARAAENSTENKDTFVGASAQKFEKLDDYLRGNLDPLEAGRASRRQTLAKTQGAQEKVKARNKELAANMTQPVLGGAPPPPDIEEEELYFASVLICDSEDGEDAERAKKLLEKAGYFVDVEWDGRKVYDLLSLFLLLSLSLSAVTILHTYFIYIYFHI